jgi:uracil-DNA glycosylase
MTHILHKGLRLANGPVARAVEAFLQGHSVAHDPPQIWQDLPFFHSTILANIVDQLDGLIAQGETIVPPPEQMFHALTLTPFSATKVVILGQDPYPTPNDAHGLAFSYQGRGRLPASLKVILNELETDTGLMSLMTGDLTPWARQGVLLMNAALSTEAGRSGAHMKMGWKILLEQMITALSHHKNDVVFLLWGSFARSFVPLIDPAKHLILESGHPSPLNRLRDFQGSRPFSKTNAFLIEKGLTPIDWTL